MGQPKMASEIANCALVGGGPDLPLAENQLLLSCFQLLLDHTTTLPPSLFCVF